MIYIYSVLLRHVLDLFTLVNEHISRGSSASKSFVSGMYLHIHNIPPFSFPYPPPPPPPFVQSDLYLIFFTCVFLFVVFLDVLFLSDVQQEPWFGSEYVEKDIPSSLFELWKDPTEINACLHLPAKNEFVPSDFSIRAGKAKCDSENTRPRSILDEPLMRIWYKLDNTFKLPRANTYFRITLKGGYSNLKNALLTELFIHLLKDELNEIIYQASVAKLETSVSLYGDKLELKVYGFNDKLPVLLSKVLAMTKSFSPRDDRFMVIKEDMVRTLKNTNMKPLNHSSYLRLQVLCQSFWDVEEKLFLLNDLTLSDLNFFIPELLSQLYIEGLCHGNLLVEEALNISKIFRSNFSVQPLPFEMRHKEYVMCLPTAADLVKDVRVKNKLETNSVVELYFQIEPEEGTALIKLKAVIDLFDELVEEPLFNQLRTKEQLGYVVDCSARVTYRITGFCFRVQSSDYDPVYLQGRIENFINGVEELLREPEIDMEQETLKAASKIEGNDLLNRCLVGCFADCNEIPTRNDVRKWAQQMWKGAQNLQTRKKAFVRMVVSKGRCLSRSQNFRLVLDLDFRASLHLWSEKVMKEIGEKCGGWIENKEETELKNYLRWARILVKGSRDLRDVSWEKCGWCGSLPQPMKEKENIHMITQGSERDITSGYHLVEWKIAQLYKEAGGLGFRNLIMQNDCLLMKWLWRLNGNEHAVWKEVILNKYGQAEQWCTNAVSTTYDTSDLWIGQEVLMQVFPGLANICTNLEVIVADSWSPQGWKFFFRRHLNVWEVGRLVELLPMIDGFIGTTVEDEFIGKGKACLTYEILQKKGLPIDGLDDKSFESYRSGLIAKLLEKDPSLAYETNRFWGQITDKRYMFDMSEKEAEELRSIQKSDLIEWYRTYLRQPSPKCRRLCVRVWGCNTDWKDADSPVASAEVIKDVISFKKSAKFYPSLC
ncbi:hypothetical protein MTR67_039293 [Solanum verrucosum]|uniref:Uncharacterized protein n=1 Tax=Solanum verrucosum TaxID=315347 RepID=A0AAF0UGN9_SOLVR|nr:hypothetical protein MTR67_039293 [Solanum verrucosum]